MATFRKQINSERYTNQNGNVQFEISFIIKDVETDSTGGQATHIADALNAVDQDTGDRLPEIGDAASAPPTNVLLQDLFARNIDFTPVNDSKNDVYICTVTYEPPVGPGGFDPPDERIVTWTTGTLSSQVDTDIRGAEIGRRYLSIPWQDENDRRWLSPSLVEDMDVQLGADVVIPTIDFEVRMPSGTPLDLGTYTTLTGTVNRDSFDIRGITIPARHCLYHGATADVVGPTADDYQITHRFSVGRVNLPTNVPRYRADPLNPDVNIILTPWSDQMVAMGLGSNDTYAPIQFGWFGNYVARVVDRPEEPNPPGGHEERDIRLDDLPKMFKELDGGRTEVQVIGKRLAAVLVFQLYKDRDWAPLLIADP